MRARLRGFAFVVSLLVLAAGTWGPVAFLRADVTRTAASRAGGGGGGASTGSANTWTAEQSMSAQLRISDGTSTEPSVVFTSDDDGSGTGIFRRQANVITFTNNNGVGVEVNGGSLTLAGSLPAQTAWTSGALGTGTDTGFTRFGVGVVRVTNASTGVRGLLGGGAAVASAAALPLPTGRVFHVTGTTSITSITSTNFQSGVCITMIFDGILTVTDNNGTLDTAGNFVTSANDTISLCYDGTNWYETGRSVN